MSLHNICPIFAQYLGDHKLFYHYGLGVVMAELSCFLLQLIYCAGFGKGKWNELSSGSKVTYVSCLCLSTTFLSTMDGSSIFRIYGRSNDKE